MSSTEPERVRRDLDHLPAVQQGELERVVAILMRDFEAAISGATQPWKRNGKVLKVILFGSYARDDWVDEPENGYQSDFDLLVIVNHADLTDVADYWYIAEDRIQRDQTIGRQVNIIVHSLDEVNNALRRGEYFWTDIARDGIALYELPQHSLATPAALTPVDAYAMSREYFDSWFPETGRRLEAFQFEFEKASVDIGWAKGAAFALHQSAERLFGCYLLTRSLYFPRSHNIKFLRSLAEDKEPRLVVAWPRATKQDRRRFELLKRAYVEARYSPNYTIEMADLEALAVAVRALRAIVETVCLERLEVLKAEAGI
ncbi:MAG: HEPN domain-containing protein [Sphingomonas sp.]|jgi:predicted nucleotidyltransferase|uniref:HEPN domain-containing protein n=1 Tax=Sphingomonas sp. TaxID=28214 RepID=UPI0035623F7E